jgi:hypothetical protein
LSVATAGTSVFLSITVRDEYYNLRTHAGDHVVVRAFALPGSSVTPAANLFNGASVNSGSTCPGCPTAPIHATITAFSSAVTSVSRQSRSDSVSSYSRHWPSCSSTICIRPLPDNYSIAFSATSKISFTAAPRLPPTSAPLSGICTAPLTFAASYPPPTPPTISRVKQRSNKVASVVSQHTHTLQFRRLLVTNRLGL